MSADRPTWRVWRRKAITAVALLAPVGIACVHRERHELEAARQDHLDCVAEHSPEHADCLALEERLLAVQRRYEENARRAWSCDPAREECPTPR